MFVDVLPCSPSLSFSLFTSPPFSFSLSRSIIIIILRCVVGGIVLSRRSPRACNMKCLCKTEVQKNKKNIYIYMREKILLCLAVILIRLRRESLERECERERERTKYYVMRTLRLLRASLIWRHLSNLNSCENYVFRGRNKKNK